MVAVLIAIIIVGALVIAGMIAWYVTDQRRRAGLKQQFGREYDRTLTTAGSRREAERELAGREKRHDQLDIRPLDPQRRVAYRAEWSSLQSRFVDAPAETCGEADTLLKQVMSERGYPVGDFESRTADLSVDHADVVEHYRAAHRIAELNRQRGASTEDLRQALVHYRALFASLLDDEGDRTDEAAYAAPGTSGRSTTQVTDEGAQR